MQPLAGPGPMERTEDLKSAVGKVAAIPLRGRLSHQLATVERKLVVDKLALPSIKRVKKDAKRETTPTYNCFMTLDVNLGGK